MELKNQIKQFIIIITTTKPHLSI